MTTTIPERGTDAYRWWERGALAEAEARNEGLTEDAQGARSILETIQRTATERGEDEPVADTAATIAAIYAAGQPLSARARLAWRIVEPTRRGTKVTIGRAAWLLWGVAFLVVEGLALTGTGVTLSSQWWAAGGAGVPLVVWLAYHVIVENPRAAWRDRLPPLTRKMSTVVGAASVGLLVVAVAGSVAVAAVAFAVVGVAVAAGWLARER